MRLIKQHGRQFGVYAIYVVGLTLIQFTFSGWLVPVHFMPDLALIMVIISGYFFGRDDGVVIGLVAGFLRDMLAGRYLGLGMLLLMFAGLIAATMLINFFQRNILLVLLQVALITIFYEIALIIITFLFPMLPDQIYSFEQLISISLRTIGPQLLVNIIASVPLLLLLNYLGPYPKGQKKTGIDDDSGENVWRMT